MDFQSLPDNAFLEIIHYLPFKEKIRIGRVSLCFYRMSLIAMGEIRTLNLCDNIFRRLKAEKLETLFYACSKRLRRAKLAFDLPLVHSFAQFSYPRLTELDLGSAAIDNETFADFIESNRNLQKVIWEFRSCSSISYRPDFPNVVCEKLKAVKFGRCTDGSLASMTGRLPNLKHFECEIERISENVFDAFLASCPTLEALIVRSMKTVSFRFMDLTHFWMLSSLRVLIIANEPRREMVNEDLRMIAMAFPKLEILELVRLKVTNRGVAHLSTLANLRHLILTNNAYNSLDDSISRFGKCDQLEIARFDIDLAVTTVGWLVQSCPGLREICVYRMKFIGDAAQTAAVAAQAFSELLLHRGRNLVIRISHPESAEIWMSKEVKRVFDRIKDATGNTVRVEEGSFSWGEMTLTFDT